MRAHEELSSQVRDDSTFCKADLLGPDRELTQYHISALRPVNFWKHRQLHRMPTVTLKEHHSMLDLVTLNGDLFPVERQSLT